MMGPWRPLALAAAFTVTVGIGTATAQTVFVRHAPPGSTIELVLNAATVASATADARGDAMLALKTPATEGKGETSARVYVDVCDKLRRVLFVEPGTEVPPPGGACDRKEIAGLFAVRRVTTFVLDLAGPIPMLWLRQGPVPVEWLVAEPGASPVGPRRRSPTGLVLFGGGSFAEFRDAVGMACGTVEECSGDAFKHTYNAGVAYWFTRFLAAEASYMKPAKVTANGSEYGYRFNSFLDTRLLTVAGKGGVPIGPVRFFGLAGANYHQATSSTTETIDDVTVIVDDVTQTFLGGTQTFEMKTAGWSWMFGGGIEIWATSSLGIYAEGRYAKVKGVPVGGGEGGLDDRATFILFGARIHIGR